jgi:hypothetical protein
MSVAASGTVYGQRRDYMTEAEIELVRENQEIDKRIEILARMIDRRFKAAGINVNAPVTKSKNAGEWGPEPSGTRLELFTDMARLLEKAIDDIDQVAVRREAFNRRSEKGEDLFPKAVRKLAEAAQRYLPPLRTEAAKQLEDKELGAVLSAIEFCEQIIEAESKVPPESKKSKN